MITSLKKKQILEIAKFYGVKVIFCKIGYCSGEFLVDGKVILLDKNLANFSTFFHELGHYYCVSNGLWEAYHTDLKRIRNKKEMARKAYRTGYKAEKWVDRWARREMGMWFPEMIYVAGYGCNESKKWLHENYLKPMYSRYL